YFKFLSMMQQQDLSEAMLLYDEINRKGFEGDLVLNGLSEFFRNLLVCQDEKAASLLDTVESFREKYLAAAAGIKAEFLISALNILTEAEINYRSARNKKLHVEMALIRLCYLQQAISLATGEQGLIKKKMTDGAVAFRTALIQRYTVNSTTASSTSQPLPPTKSIPKETGARLVIETTEEKKQPEKTTAQATTTPKLNALTKIREQFKTNTNAAIEAVNKELEQNSLQLAWLAYAQLLKEAKNPAAQPIEAANLRVVDANSFEVVTHNNIEQRFIEQERNPLFQFLQHKLDNRVLQFSVLVEEQPATMPSSEVMLSVKEQYQELVKRYPIIQELKERLRLELDY
ncbi:MAG: DNA polymerase III subunit gamma/tau, partial [Chitinophagaceae bacterium]